MLILHLSFNARRRFASAYAFASSGWREVKVRELIEKLKPYEDNINDIEFIFPDDEYLMSGYKASVAYDDDHIVIEIED